MGSEEENLLHEMGARDPSGLLDEDNVPNENQSMSCFSCEEQMTGLFCYACGNKNDNYRRSVWSLGVELFQSLTAFEGRIWKSLYSLILKPGEMARDYADGARQKWTSPMRLFLATSLLLFGYIALSGTQMVALGDVVKNDNSIQPSIHFVENGENYNQRLLFFVRQSRLVDVSQLESTGRANRFFDNLQGGLSNLQDPEALQRAITDIDTQIEAVQDSASREALLEVRDSLEDALEDVLDSLDLDEIDLSAQNAPSQDTVVDDGIPNGDTPSDGDTLSDDDDTIGSSLSITGTNGQTINLNREGMEELYARVLRNPQVINNQLNTKLKWAMFIMMPLAMFMGALFIRGRETAMLYDHLVHAAYVHAFSFLLLFVFILLSQYTSVSWLILTYTLILLIYLPISAKRTFRRGWFKSILTAYGVGSVYTLIIFIISAGIVLQALQTVAYDISESNAVAASPPPVVIPITPPTTEPSETP